MELFKFFLIFIVLKQSEGMKIHCEYKKESWSILFTVYQCNATVSLLVDSDQSKVTGVTGNHMEGKTNSDVEFLIIQHQNLQAFPKEIEIFPDHYLPLAWFFITFTTQVVNFIFRRDCS
jgi:hypothetical protein